MTPQIAIVGFRELDNPDAWRVEVVVDGVVSGHIYRGGGAYRYFEGPRNDRYGDRKSTRLNSSHLVISYAVFCLKKNRKPAIGWFFTAHHELGDPYYLKSLTLAPAPNVLSTVSAPDFHELSAAIA